MNEELFAELIASVKEGEPFCVVNKNRLVKYIWKVRTLNVFVLATI